MYGRIIFGASAALSGVVQLIWHDSEIWQLMKPLGTPAGTIVGWCLVIAMIAGGIAMIVPQLARAASVVVGAVFLVFTLDNVPGMFATPKEPGLYVNFFEQLSIVCGAFAVYARSATLGAALRIVLGVCTVSFAWAQVVYLQYTASLVPAWIPPNGVFWTNLTTAAFGLAAIAMLINVRARLAMRLMALMIALFGIIVWVPKILAQPHDLSNWNEITANYLIAAASWLVSELEK